jgi:hypothetical protein
MFYGKSPDHFTICLAASAMNPCVGGTVKEWSCDRDIAEQWTERTMFKSLRLSLAVAGAISVLSLANGAYATEYDRHVDIVNRSDRDIVEFHASNVGRPGWGPDLLGSYVLSPGDVERLNLDDGTGYCRFDFKSIMEDGTPVIRWGLNVCEVADYTIY